MHAWNGDQPTATKVQKKTQAYLDQLHKNDWIKSAYFDQELGFYVPGDNIDGMFREAGTKARRGKDFQAFAYCPDDRIPLIVYKNHDDKKGASLNGKLENHYKAEYIDTRGVRLGAVRIDRTRPIFRHWGLQFHYHYDDAVLELDAVKAALGIGCIGDYRPRYGRFEVENIEQQS
jgi:hypothetical protein